MMKAAKLLTTLWACAMLIVLADSARSVVILADDFADADRSSQDGTITAWNVVNGIAAPSTTLQFFDGDSPDQVGFHNNNANPGTFDVNNNMTAGGWDTTFTLEVGGSSIDLTELVVDIKLTNGSGGNQTTNSKQGQLLVEFFDASELSVGSADLGGNQGYPTVSYQRTLDLTGISLAANETYTMVLQARGSGFGHHKALDALELNGDIGGGSSGTPGDYNGDEMVDLADYTLWRNNLGEPAGTLPNDSNTGLPIGTEQYDTWRSNFGASGAGVNSLTVATVPEPSTIVLLASIACLGLITLSNRR